MMNPIADLSAFPPVRVEPDARQRTREVRAGAGRRAGRGRRDGSAVIEVLRGTPMTSAREQSGES